MGRHAACILGLVLNAGVATDAAGAAWSPNGRWLAYVQGPSAQASRPTGSWLFADRRDVPARTAPSPEAKPRRYRLWATQFDGSAAVLLDESERPIGGPTWNPEGTALAYARTAADADGTLQTQVVVKDGTDRLRVLYTRRPIEAAPAPEAAWSPDGRHLAVTWPASRGLLILRADDGRILKTLDDATAPSWSPDGARLAFFRVGRDAGLWCLDRHFGPPRRIAPLAAAGQPPSWTQDGQALRVVQRRRDARQGDGTDAEIVELVRVAADTGRAEPVLDFSTQSLSGLASYRGALFSADDDFESLFYAVPLADAPQEIVWTHPRRKMIVSRFHPVDFSIPIRSLRVNPSATKLAIRFGEDHGPIGIYDVESKGFEPIAPDDDGRSAWLDLLAATARSILRDRPASPDRRGDAPTRPTILPILGDLEPNSPQVNDLKRMARLGLPLGAALSAEATAARADIDEIRLILDYAAGNYEAALDALRPVAAAVRTADERLRLLGLRVQILLAMGDGGRAAPLLDYLKGRVPTGRQRVEEGPEGRPSLVPDPSPAELWLGRLLVASAATAKGEAAEADPLPGNPDNPLDDPLRNPFGQLDGFGRIDEVQARPRLEPVAPPR